MEKTQTTPNRTIIYTMNLWVKRIAGGLCVAAAVLFVSCLDEDNIAGFRNDNRKFKTSFVEIPLTSSVLLFDSLRTSNYFSDPIRRMLVGKYTDPAFGLVRSETYTQFLPQITTKAKEEGAMFDSITLILTFDYYHYGATAPTTETFKVYELTEELTFRGNNDYYNFKDVAYNPALLGEASLSISPESFDTLINYTAADTLVQLQIRLADTYGNALFDFWDPASSTYKDFRNFVKFFKGLAIVPGDNNQQIIGIATGNTTKVRLHYQTPTTDSLFFDFPVNSTVNASHFQYDRSTTALNGISKYQDFVPLNDKRYVQNGGLIATKFDLDLSGFFEFADTTENLVINSAEISIDEIDDPENYPVPKALFIQILNNNNRLKQFAGTDKPTQRLQDSLDLVLYSNSGLTLTNGLQGLNTSTISLSSVFTPIADTQRDLARLTYIKDDERYVGYLTLFFQELAKQESTTDGFQKTRFPKFVLYPSDPYAAKSFNRVVFNKQALKLRIYYTQPTIN